jgi:hypothetical protein
MTRYKTQQAHGFHPEEAAARFADCDMPLPYPDCDQLRIFIMDLGKARNLARIVT